jgi:hypothetical protein
MVSKPVITLGTRNDPVRAMEKGIAQTTTQEVGRTTRRQYFAVFLHARSSRSHFQGPRMHGLRLDTNLEYPENAMFWTEGKFTAVSMEVI